MLKTINMRPGINKDITEYLAEGGWVDCDHIRFKSSIPMKLGGWVKDTIDQVEKFGAFSSAFSSAYDLSTGNDIFTGVARDITAWTALDNSRYLAVGTHLKVELFANNQIYDITPKRTTANLTDALTTVINETLVTITSNAHNLVVGDYVDVISQATPVGGITLLGTYKVYSITDVNNFKIDARVAATSSAGPLGGALVIDYLLPSGFQHNENITGWGGGTWGTEGESGQGWNRPRAGIGASNLRQWSLDTWGEDLLACVRGGGIYQWDKTNGENVRLQTISGAPSENSFILVSQPSRHLIAFGSEVEATSVFDPLIIRWAEQETLTGWTIAADNTAGEFRLPKGNTIIGAVQTRSEIIIFTETDLYSMRYVGGNEIFRITPLGTNISVTSQHCFIDVNGVIFWKGTDGFYMYDGVIRSLPSTLSNYLFAQDSDGRINFAQKEKIYIGINKEHHEIWWFYPLHSELENSNYVKYNYIEKVWDIGTIERTVWLDKGVYDKPYALNTSGKLYVHEQGYNDDAAPLNSFITSAYFDLDDGDDLIFVDKIIPDVTLPANRPIQISVLTKKEPHPEDQVTTKGPYSFEDTNNKISLRARGRQMALKFETTTTDGNFSLGKIRLNVQPDGKR